MALILTVLLELL